MVIQRKPDEDGIAILRNRDGDAGLNVPGLESRTALAWKDRAGAPDSVERDGPVRTGAYLDMLQVGDRYGHADLYCSVFFHIAFRL